MLFLHSAVWQLASVINCVCMCVLLEGSSLRVSGCLYLHSLLWSDLWKTSHDQCCFPPYPAKTCIHFMHHVCWACCYIIESCCNHFLMKTEVHIRRQLCILSLSAVIMVVLWGGKQLNVSISYKLCESLFYWQISVLSYV